jgi:MoaA/NifB/PqqE/SkfB family radical SAM enzyme
MQDTVKRVLRGLLGSKYYELALKFKTPQLTKVHIEPTNVCNLRCKRCYAQNPSLFAKREQGFMDLALFKRLVDEIAGYPQKVFLGLNYGGESLLHPQFAEMVKYAVQKKKFSVGFTTNGVLIDDAMINTLSTHRVDDIVVSLDGMSEAHESLRSGSKYSDVRVKILRLKKVALSRISVNLTQSSQKGMGTSRRYRLCLPLLHGGAENSKWQLL